MTRLYCQKYRHTLHPVLVQHQIKKPAQHIHLSYFLVVLSPFKIHLGYMNAINDYLILHLLLCTWDICDCFLWLTYDHYNRETDINQHGHIKCLCCICFPSWSSHVYWMSMGPFTNPISIYFRWPFNPSVDKQRVLMHRHQGLNVRHGLCHIYMRYLYIYELFIAFVCFVVCSLL